MKNYIFVFLLILTNSACKAQESSFDSNDLYYKSNKGRIYELQFLENGRFSFEIKSPPHSTSKCVGEWEKESDESLILKCDEEQGASSLISTYMSKREWKVKVLSKNRILLDGVVLKKK